MKYLVIMLLILQSSVVYGECKQDPSKFWICTGDKAWYNGYLVDPVRMEELTGRSALLDEMKAERDEYKSLLDSVQDSRDQYSKLVDDLKFLLGESQTIREEYKSQRDNMELELVSAEDDLQKKTIEYETCKIDESNGWSEWEVGFLTVGVGVLSILAGAGIYAIVD